MEKNLHILPRVADSSSFLYIEKSFIEKDDTSVTARAGETVTRIPAASILALVLGPGTSITHAAVAALGETGCSVIWAGEDSVRFYAAGGGRSRSSAAVMRQALAWAEPGLRLEVTRRMYRMRFPEPLPANLTLQQLRGKEGVRVREAYQAAARAAGIEWRGRNYDRSNWADADPVNRALSAGAACLYGACHGAIAALGYSPAIGFIHTGKQLSFVYDVADLYKIEVLLPAAFEAAANTSERVESAVRRALRARIQGTRMLERVSRDLSALFNDLTEAGDIDFPAEEIESSDVVGQLWDPSGNVDGGVNHAGDDA
jgi:CRISPR-associated protein Cas1